MESAEGIILLASTNVASMREKKIKNIKKSPLKMKRAKGRKSNFEMTGHQPTPRPISLERQIMVIAFSV